MPEKDHNGKFTASRESKASSLSCDIVLLPEPSLARKAVALSEQLKAQSALFTLRDGTCFPHVSLYMVQLKAADLDKVGAALAETAASRPPHDLVAAKYGQAEGYIDAEYIRTRALERLQATVVEAVSPLRSGLSDSDKVRLTAAAGKVRENLEKYGYRGVGELFRPHLTFTRFEDSSPIETSTLPDPAIFSGRFTRLGLFETGVHGTCIRKIAEFGLAEH